MEIAREQSYYKHRRITFAKRRGMPKPTAIERAIKYIKANWRKGKSLKEIAQRYRVDAGNLERAFKSREGVTIKQFIDQRRKAHVVSRLIHATVYGYELGAELGFANGRAFYRWVQRVFGNSYANLRSQLVTIRQQNRYDKK